MAVLVQSNDHSASSKAKIKLQEQCFNVASDAVIKHEIKVLERSAQLLIKGKHDRHTNRYSNGARSSQRKNI